MLHDLLGIYPGRAPRFAKQYVELRSQMVAAVAEYADDVRAHRFPAPEHTFSIDPGELGEFLALEELADLVGDDSEPVARSTGT